MEETTKPHALIESTTGVLLGIQSVMNTVVVAFIIFNGHLIKYLPLGINMALLSAAILKFIVSIKSSSPILMAGIQEIFGVIAYTMISAIVTAILLHSSTADPLPTALLSLILLTMIFGIWIFFLGRYKLGNWIQFIPYPITSGFLAATGWLLFKSAFTMTTGITPTLAHFSQMVNTPLFWLTIASLFYSCIILKLASHYRHPIVLLTLIAIPLIAFYLILWGTGTTLAQAQEMQLLFAQLDKTSSHQLFLFSQFNWTSLQQIQWHILFENMGQYPVFLIIASITVLLNLNGFELISRQELNINKDLKILGAANFITGLMGGYAGYTSLSSSAMNYNLGSRTMLPGLLSASICLIALFFSDKIVLLVPKFILSILTFYVALDFLLHWLIFSWKRLSKWDYFVLLIIFISIVILNLLTGFIIGMVLAAIVFVIRYGQLSVIKAIFPEEDPLRSNVNWGIEDERWLIQYGDKQYTIVLQGYLYFGNINRLILHIKEHLKKIHHSLQFILIDFRAVNGIDSSAVLGLVRIIQMSKQKNVTVVLTHISKLFREQLKDIIAEYDASLVYQQFADLDHGLEWIEEHILQNASKEEKFILSHTSLDELKAVILSIQKAGDYIQRITVEAGHTIYQMQETAENLYYIESGFVEIFITNANQQEIRLRQIHAGTIFGEIGMYLNINRTANVRAKDTCVLLCLSREAMLMLEQQHPELANALHHQIIKTLSSHLIYSNSHLLTIFEENVQ